MISVKFTIEHCSVTSRFDLSLCDKICTDVFYFNREIDITWMIEFKFDSNDIQYSSNCCWKESQIFYELMYLLDTNYVFI